MSVPVPLMQVSHFITGMIEIENENDLNAILAAIYNGISNYIFSAVVQLGYQQLLQDEFDINEIFNGPLLQNGWVPDAQVGLIDVVAHKAKVEEVITIDPQTGLAIMPSGSTSKLLHTNEVLASKPMRDVIASLRSHRHSPAKQRR